LNFITIKKDARFEYRLYTETQEQIEGQILYKGHKLGVDQALLSNILMFKSERNSNNYYIYDYLSDDMWFKCNSSDVLLAINKSYETLQSKAENQFGKFRKVIITRV
jgi:hypothetical protein